MAPRFRVIDTGLREGRANIAFDQALIELHRDGVIPDSLRFLQFRPSALIGRHQALSREIRLDYAKVNGISVVRRITGGGAIYMDEGQFGFELVFSKRTLGLGGLGEVAAAICEAAAFGLRGLGINARFRPRNDIEVEGRKISGTGGFFDGDTIFYQGTVLVEMDPTKMLGVLNVPREKLAKHELDSAASRIVTLRELLGADTPGLPQIKTAMVEGFAKRLGVEPIAGAITSDEEALAAKICAEDIGTDAFVHELDDPAGQVGVRNGSLTGKGGTVNAHVRLDGARIREVLITGDFFVTPPRTILDLEAALRGIETREVEARVAAFFAVTTVGLLSVTPADFSGAIQAAIV